MPLRISHRKSFERCVKKFKKQKPIKKLIQAKVLEIMENPKIGIPMSGNVWIDFLKVPFGEKPEYRILYAVYSCCHGEPSIEDCLHEDFREVKNSGDICDGVLEFVFVKTREECNNLYNKNKKYVNNFRREIIPEAMSSDEKIDFEKE